MSVKKQILRNFLQIESFEKKFAKANTKRNLRNRDKKCFIPRVNAHTHTPRNFRIRVVEFSQLARKIFSR